MNRICVSMQKYYCDAFNLVFAQDGYQISHRILVQLQQHLTLCIAPFDDGQTQIPRHQRSRFVDIDVVLVKTMLIAHFYRISETLSDDHRGVGTLAFNHRIRRQCGAMYNETKVFSRNSSLREYSTNASHNALFRRLGRG